MKITDVRTTVVRGGGGQNWTFVHVDTDEGISGLGEATLEGKTLTMVAAVDDLKRHLVGENPLAIEHHWQRLYRHAFWRGGVVLNTAISGVEQALWDIMGKALNVPVWQLFGGPTRQKIRAYANGPGGHTPDEVAESARQIVADGFTAMKLAPTEAARLVEGPDLIRHADARIGAIRKAVGMEVDIILDAHGRLSPATAIMLIDALKDYRILFWEEPVLPENTEALAKVAAHSVVPLATGERLFTKWGFREVCDRQLVSVIQPDLAHCGGIAEGRKIAAMAEASYIAVAPHNPYSPVNTAASLHLDAAIPNFLIQEWIWRAPPWRDEIVSPPVRVVDGYFDLPQGPGLGIELNTAVAATHPYEPADQPPLWHTDGSVADW